jgi:DNA-binding SARP family transcriptional activator
LLEEDRFDLAAEQLQRLAHDGKIADLRTREMLALLQSLCQALHQCRSEVEFYRWATDMVAQRQDDLQKSLMSALNLADEHFAPPCNDASVQVVQPASFAIVPREPQAIEMLNSPSAPTKPRRQTLQRAERCLMAYTLGSFEVYVDDQRVVDFPNRKSLSLFRYLLVHRRPIHRESLIEQFWEGSDTELARNRLNNTLYGVREALRRGDDKSTSYVVYENEHYRLNPEIDVWTDYEAFSEACRDGRAALQSRDTERMLSAFQEAVLLYQGAFMPDAPYEDWIENERTQLQNDYLVALDALSNYGMETGDYAACISNCQKLLQVDACHEEAHRRLMRCYARQGQSYLAQRQYQWCVRILKDGLDMEPMPETSQLYAQIREGQLV